MDKHRLSRRRFLRTVALTFAGGGVFGCGRKRDVSRNPGYVSGWDVVQSGLQGPGPRSRHCFVYDSGAKVCVIFGGISWADGGVPYSDCWELRDGNWSPVGGSNSPVGRQRGAMVYDSKRGHSVLFGGQGKRKNDWPSFGDTWFYANRRWQQWDAGSGKQPEPRAGHSLAFDEETGMVVLFGGLGIGYVAVRRKRKTAK